MILLLASFVFSVIRVTVILRQRDINRQANEQLAMLTVAPSVQTPVESAPATETEPEPELSQCPPAPITVDFERLKQENADIVAWIHCPDTPIHYPVVQGQDNVFYLEHMIDGRRNNCGSIFLDYRSSAGLTDDYSLIHGHNLKNDTMFGSLPQYEEQAYYDAHKVLYVLTPERTYVLTLFAGFVTDSDDGLYNLPLTEKAREELIETSMARSDFSTELRPGAEDRIMALSTCSYAYDDARYVVLGILRESETATHRK